MCTEFPSSYRTEIACPLPLHRRRCPPGPSSMMTAPRLSPMPPLLLSPFFDFDFLPLDSAWDLPPSLPPPVPHSPRPLAPASVPAAVPAQTPAPRFPHKPPCQPRAIPFSSDPPV